MPHKIEISDKTYEMLKDFCVLNKLKIGQFTDKLLYDSLMIEMYGDVPFMNYKTPQKEFKEIQVVNEFSEKMAEGMKEAEKQMSEMVNEPKKEEFEPIDPSELIFDEPKKEEILKENGVPDKVIKKITKRRLK